MELKYQTGFGNEFATEAVEGRVAGRAEFAAEGPAWVVCRAVFRNGIHGAAGDE